MTATYKRPNFTTMGAAELKAAIEASFQALERLGLTFVAHEQDVGSPQPDMSVRVDAGHIWSGGVLTEVAAQTVSGFTVPSAGQHRIDRVVIDATTGVATRVAGTPATGSPSAVPPAIPAGKFPCCRVEITSSDTAITNDMIYPENVHP